MLTHIFEHVDSNKNFSYNGDGYADHPNAAIYHNSITLGGIQNRVLAIGGLTVEVELFDIISNSWSKKKPFPFCTEWLVHPWVKVRVTHL